MPTPATAPDPAPAEPAGRRAAPALRLWGVSRRFGPRWALRDIDLEVPRGAAVALVGPNGAGKTTLLRVLATLLRPSRGEVEVLGRSARRDGDEIRRRLALLTASGFLYDELTGRENLRFGTLMTGRAPDRRAIDGALERVGLAGAADLRVRAYSTGMRKRLELARLFLRPVELLLLDEPYASLDREGVALVDRFLARFRESGGTLLLASHGEGDAERAADRVVRLRGGRRVEA